MLRVYYYYLLLLLLSNGGFLLAEVRVSQTCQDPETFSCRRTFRTLQHMAGCSSTTVPAFVWGGKQVLSLLPLAVPTGRQQGLNSVDR